MTKVYKILARKCDGKRPLDRPKCSKYKLKDNVKTEWKKSVCESVDWIYLAQHSV